MSLRYDVGPEKVCSLRINKNKPGSISYAAHISTSIPHLISSYSETVEVKHQWHRRISIIYFRNIYDVFPASTIVK